jgi:hypothetical protein
MGQATVLPLRRGSRAEDFFAPKNPTASAGFEPANLSTRRQHANYETTEAAKTFLPLSLRMSYIYGAPCKARHFNVIYIWTYVWHR